MTIHTTMICDLCGKETDPSNAWPDSSRPRAILRLPEGEYDWRRMRYYRPSCPPVS